MKRVLFHPGWKTTRMRPTIRRGHDEFCNEAVTVVVWPVGHVDVFWGRRLRTPQDGPCDTCRAEHALDGVCVWCGSSFGHDRAGDCMCPYIYPWDVLEDRGWVAVRPVVDTPPADA